MQNIEFKKYLIIGNGKIAKHFSFYFSSLNIPFLQWDRSQSDSLLNTKLAESSHALILISDKAIWDFYISNLKGKDIVAIHCSGALTFENIWDFHPLMTFGTDLYDSKFYLDIPLITTGQYSLPKLQNKIIRISKDEKPFYHALCVVSGNFPQMIAVSAMQNFKKLGIDATYIGQYVVQGIKNISNGSPKNLTGPLVRKDSITIENNLKSLDGTEFKNLYQTMLRFYEHQSV